VDFGIRMALRIPQRAIVTVTTNVPGPREQLYLLGRPIREILPYVPIAERMRIGVSVFTYGGQAAIAVTTDFASVPEADRLAGDVVTEVNALAAARVASPASPAARPPNVLPAETATTARPRRRPAMSPAHARRHRRTTAELT
jgi:diacylglycerol O-acyltransferase